MSHNYHQNHVITILNQYLEYHNFPAVCRLDTGGVCNGLACLYAKYVLEKKETEFLEILEYMTGKKPEVDADKVDEKVNRFVIEVLKYASPELFTDNMGQAKAYQEIVVDGENIKPAFTLGLVTPKENWVDIFSSINLCPGEAMMVSGINHAVSISRNINGNYIVYDPNYSTGTKTFGSENELIENLSHNVFDYQNTNIGLAIKIIRPKNSPTKTYPTIDDIYKKCVNPHEREGGATSLLSNRTTYLLEFAAKVSDMDAIRKLIKLKQIKGLKDAMTLLYKNNTEIPEELLEKFFKNDKIHLLRVSAYLGKRESFYCILKNLKSTLQTLDQTDCIVLMNCAANSSNPSLLKDIVDCFDNLPSIEKSDEDFKAMDNMQHSESILITNIFKRDTDNKDTIMHAICSQSAACLTVLLDRLDENTKVLTAEQQLEYLSLAIAQNNPIMVETLVKHGNNRIPQKLLETISLPYDVIKRTDIYLLKMLQNHGVIFSKSGQAIIDQKEHRNVGPILAIGIKLMQFMDWLRDIWAQHITTHHTNKHLIFRTSDVSSEPENKSVSKPDTTQSQRT